jgi:hypothetical protein
MAFSATFNGLFPRGNLMQLSPKLRLTDEETQVLVETCETFTNDQRRDFLRKLDLPISGNKAELVQRIKDGLESGVVPVDSLIFELDQIVPWWRFHVFLFDTPPISSKPWASKKTATAHLEKHGLLGLFNARIALVLPPELTLTSINYSPSNLRVTAVQRRDYTARDEALDPEDAVVDGATIEYRAFAQKLARGIVSLEWDFASQTAILQITELPSGTKYETVRDAFVLLIRPWLAIAGFTQVNLSNAITALHKSELRGEREVRSHGIEFRTLEGRRLSARSATIGHSVLGEDVIDASLERISKEGVGHSGNFYWLPTDGDTGTADLEREVHVVLIAEKNRASLRTRSTTNVTEQEMRHVLSRLRELSK